MWDNIQMALQSLKSNKMRALLTMLGIIIGIGSVIAIKTVGNSLSGTITNSLSGLGVSNITVSLTQKESDDNSSGTRVRMFMNSTPSESDLISDEMIEEFQQAFSESVEYIEKTISVGSSSLVNASNDTVSFMVTGVNDDYFSAEEIVLLYGRQINNQKDGDKKVVYVADCFVEDYLGIPAQNAIGTSITVTLQNSKHNFYILGVYEYEQSEMTLTSNNSSATTTMYIPLETARIITDGSDGYQSITVVANNATETTEFIETVEEYFASYYTRNDTWTVEASSLESLVSTLTDILDKISLAISAIAAISLLVGGIGVMNIMLVSVTERTKEIGTRKALGAPQKTIRMQFIIESVVICLIGGFIGILLGFGLGALACKILGYSAMADIGSIILVVSVSTGIGIFFGYYPANKAAKLDPIEALRYE